MSTDKYYNRVGTQFLPDGAHSILRSGKNTDLIGADGSGRMAEGSVRSETYVGSTAVAGVALGEAFTTTPPFVLHNPAGSGVLVSVLKVSLAYVSGTVADGSVLYGEYPQLTAPSGGTAITPNCTRLGVAAGKATAGTGHTITGAATILRPSGFIVGDSTAATVGLPVTLVDNVDGEITLPEQQAFIIEGLTSGAGSTPLFLIGVTWQEIPNPS